MGIDTTEENFIQKKVMPNYTLQRYGTPFLGCITFHTTRDVMSHETCIFAAGRVAKKAWLAVAKEDIDRIGI